MDKIFGPFIGQSVGRLDYQNPEHQHGVKRWPAAFAAIQIRQNLVQIQPEDFKIHGSGKSLKLVA